MRANRTDVSPAERLFQQFLQLDAAEQAEFLSLVNHDSIDSGADRI